MNTKRKYDRSFKERAVRLSYERSSITELASELGVLPDRIYSWRKEFGDHGAAAFPDHGVDRLSDEARRVKELEKKLWIRMLSRVCPDGETAGIMPWRRASLNH